MVSWKMVSHSYQSSLIFTKNVVTASSYTSSFFVGVLSNPQGHVGVNLKSRKVTGGSNDTAYLLASTSVVYPRLP